MEPYKLVRHTSGDVLETISFDYPDDAEPHNDVIKARLPGDPTTIDTFDVSDLTVITAKCNRDGMIFSPRVIGEYTNAHIDCPKCGRGYYIRFDDSGEFQDFYSDRALVLE